MAELMFCKHCKRPIREGWHYASGGIRPWIHDNGWYQCIPFESGNMAEPEMDLKVEFEILRRFSPKISMAQFNRMSHIEEHLDKGDVVCNCYDTELEGIK